MPSRCSIVQIFRDIDRTISLATASLFTKCLHVCLVRVTVASDLPRFAHCRGEAVFKRARGAAVGRLHGHRDHGGGGLLLLVATFAGLGAVGVLVGQRVASVLPFTALRGQVGVPAHREIWRRL